MSRWWRAEAGALRLAVRLTPKGGADRLEGVGTGAEGGEHVKARVRAAPEKGAANAALLRLVADAAGVPPSDVDIVAGAASRLKTLSIACPGNETGEIVARLEKAMAGG